MIKVYGLAMSAPVNKVRFTLNALGVAYELLPVNLMEGAGQTDEYKQIHPVGKIPAVTDEDGFTLWESNAIMKYFARKENSSLYPTDIKEQFQVDKWLDFGSIHIGAAFGRVMYNAVLAPKIGQPVDEESLKCGKQFLNRFLPVVDVQLGKTKYLAGDSLTLADIAMIATIDPAEAIKWDLSPYPNIVLWRKELKSQDWYTQCHQNYEDALATMKG